MKMPQHANLLGLSIVAGLIAVATLYIATPKYTASISTSDELETGHGADVPPEEQMPNGEIWQLSDADLEELLQHPEGMVRYEDENGEIITAFLPEQLAEEEQEIGMETQEGGTEDSIDTSGDTGGDARPSQARCANVTATETRFKREYTHAHIDRSTAITRATETAHANIVGACNRAAAGLPACQNIPGPPPIQCRSVETTGSLPRRGEVRLLNVVQKTLSSGTYWYATVENVATCTMTRFCRP